MCLRVLLPVAAKLAASYALVSYESLLDAANQAKTLDGGPTYCMEKPKSIGRQHFINQEIHILALGCLLLAEALVRFFRQELIRSLHSAHTRSELPDFMGG